MLPRSSRCVWWAMLGLTAVLVAAVLDDAVWPPAAWIVGGAYLLLPAPGWVPTWKHHLERGLGLLAGVGTGWVLFL